MTAVVNVNVRTGSGAGTLSGSVGGIDLISADNATHSLANRQANPITVGTNSYEKWVTLRIESGIDNYVRNFKIWGDGGVDSSTTLAFTAGYVTYSQGTTATSGIANVSFTTYTAGNKADWDTTTYTSTDVPANTKYAVFQLQVAATASAGTWTTETINYSYEEA